MSDYDPKSIPILDDIIENENADSAAISENEIITEEISTDDNTPDLFNDETPDIKVDDAEPEMAAFDNFIGDDTDADNSETETIESALIDYSLEENTAFDTSSAETIPEHTHTDEDPINQAHDLSERLTDSTPSITLDTIVDDIITQLMPELEQHLRIRIQQALEEKLPEEIIQQISGKNEKHTP